MGPEQQVQIMENLDNGGPDNQGLTALIGHG